MDYDGMNSSSLHVHFVFMFKYFECRLVSELTINGASNFTPSLKYMSSLSNLLVRLTGRHETVILQYSLLHVPVHLCIRAETCLKKKFKLKKILNCQQWSHLSAIEVWARPFYCCVHEISG